jgi:hypothetical protein
MTDGMSIVALMLVGVSQVIVILVGFKCGRYVERHIRREHKSRV